MRWSVRWSGAEICDTLWDCASTPDTGSNFGSRALEPLLTCTDYGSSSFFFALNYRYMY